MHRVLQAISAKGVGTWLAGSATTVGVVFALPNGLQAWKSYYYGEKPRRIMDSIKPIETADFPSLGRDELERVIAEYVQQENPGAKPFLLVTGENGVGKSTIIKKVLREKAADRAIRLELVVDDENAMSFPIADLVRQALDLPAGGEINAELRDTRIGGRPLVLYLDITTKKVNMVGARKAAATIGFFAKNASYNTGGALVIVEYSCTQASDHTLWLMGNTRVTPLLVEPMKWDLFQNAANDDKNCPFPMCKDKDARECFFNNFGGRFRDFKEMALDYQVLPAFLERVQKKYHTDVEHIQRYTPKQVKLLKEIADEDCVPYDNDREDIKELLDVEVTRSVIMRRSHVNVCTKNPTLRKAVREAKVTTFGRVVLEPASIPVTAAGA